MTDLDLVEVISKSTTRVPEVSPEIFEYGLVAIENQLTRQQIKLLAEHANAVGLVVIAAQMRFRCKFNSSIEVIAAYKDFAEKLCHALNVVAPNNLNLNVPEFSLIFDSHSNVFSETDNVLVLSRTLATAINKLNW